MTPREGNQISPRARKSCRTNDLVSLASGNVNKVGWGMTCGDQLWSKRLRQKAQQANWEETDWRPSRKQGCSRGTR